MFNEKIYIMFVIMGIGVVGVIYTLASLLGYTK